MVREFGVDAPTDHTGQSPLGIIPEGALPCRSAAKSSNRVNQYRPWRRTACRSRRAAPDLASCRAVGNGLESREPPAYHRSLGGSQPVEESQCFLPVRGRVLSALPVDGVAQEQQGPRTPRQVAGGAVHRERRAGVGGRGGRFAVFQSGAGQDGQRLALHEAILRAAGQGEGVGGQFAVGGGPRAGQSEQGAGFQVVCPVLAGQGVGLLVGPARLAPPAEDGQDTAQGDAGRRAEVLVDVTVAELDGGPR